MPASGETYAFAEGKVTIWASASGNTSGSGVGFVEDAGLTLTHGWLELPNADKTYTRVETGRRADLNVNFLYAYRTLLALADASAAVNAKFEGQVGGGLQQSALYQLYSGVIDTVNVKQVQRDVWHGSLSMHATEWSAFGQ